MAEIIDRDGVARLAQFGRCGQRGVAGVVGGQRVLETDGLRADEREDDADGSDGQEEADELGGRLADERDVLTREAGVADDLAEALALLLLQAQAQAIAHAPAQALAQAQDQVQASPPPQTQAHALAQARPAVEMIESENSDACEVQ